MRNKQKKKIQNRSVEYAQFKTLRLISFLMYGVFGTLLIMSMWFLYTRMYQTIGQVETLSALSPTLGVQVLDIDEYNSVQEELEMRAAHRAPNLTRDPFNEVDVFTAYIASTTALVSPASTTTPSSTNNLE